MNAKSPFVVIVGVLLAVPALSASPMPSGGPPAKASVVESTDSLRALLEAQNQTAEKPGPAAPQTADQVKKSEQSFQNNLAELDRAVTQIENRVAEFRRMVVPPTRTEAERLNQDLKLIEQSLAALGTAPPSPLSQLQRADLQDRVLELQLVLELMNRRWGHSWKVFGSDFFSAAAQADVPEQPLVPETYRIRVGDRLEVGVTGPLGDRKAYDSRVDSTGFVSIAGAGRVRAAGLSVRQLRVSLSARIRARFAQVYVDLSVTEVQPVRVQVGGEVARPGSYSLAGTATVLSALYKAGGPTSAGSYRRISLQRPGQPRKTIDLYDFLVKGDRSLDLPLEENDLIFVPPVGGTIVVEGEVVRPGRYEPDFPLTLTQALKLAGDVNPGGYIQSVQVERIENGEYRVLLDIPAGPEAQKGAFPVKPGDLITVRPVRPERTAQVAISGPVGVPGLYGFKPGMRVSDLIRAAQGIVQDREVYGERADVLRVDPLKGIELLTFDLNKALNKDPEHDLLLQKLDRVFIYEPEQVVYRPRVVTVMGAVAKPGTYQRAQGMSVSDAIAAAGGVSLDAFLNRADLIRRKGDGTTELIRIDLRAALTRSPAADVKLEDRDVLNVYTNQEAEWRDVTVRVEGAVQRPGVYKRSDGMRVSDLLLACGGLLPEASRSIELGRWSGIDRSQVFQIDLDKTAPGSDTDLLLKDRDVLTVPEINPALRRPEVVFLYGEVARPGPYTLREDEKLVDLIRRAGGLTEWADARGLMFLRQKAALENDQQIKDVDLILEKSRAFADKQFATSLAKLGLTLPAQYVETVQAAAERLAKPVEVAAEEPAGGTQAKPQAPNTAAPGTQKSSPAPAPGTAPTVGLDALDKLTAEPTPREVETASALGPRIPELPSRIAELDLSVFKGREELAELANSARISIDLQRALKDEGAPDNIPLRNGDRISIPKKTDVVTVIGAVLHPHAFAAGPGKSVDYYIERSGGFAQDADKGSVVVVRSNGDAVPKARAKTAEPGDIIVVPTTGLIDIAKKWERISPIAKVISDVLSSVYILTRF